jgi:hypothetical protein
MYRNTNRIAYPIVVTLFLAASVNAQAFGQFLVHNINRGTSNAAAQTDPRCRQNCAEPATPVGMKRLVIDASNMTARGDVTYRKNDRLMIVLINKNPYKYKYKIDTTETTVQETALAAFLPLLGSFVGDAAAPSGKDKAAPAAAQSVAPPGQIGRSPLDDCRDALNAIIATIDVERIQANTGLDAAKAELVRLKDKHNPVRRSYSSTRTTLYSSAGATCEELCSASYRFVDGLGQTVTQAEIDSFQDRVDVLTAQGTTIEALARDALRRYRTCATPDQVDFLSTMTTFATGIKSAAGQLRSDINTIKDDLAKFSDLKAAIDSVLGNRSAFVETVEVGHFARTTEVKIDVTTKEIGDAKEEKAGPSKSLTVKFGDAPFFSLSGGIVFARLVKQEFVRVQGIQLDSNGNQVLVDGKPVVTTVVEAKEQSPTRILPLLQLNGRLKRWNGFIDGVHLSLGITAKNDNKGTDVEYLVGPSFSMADEQLFLTFGGYAGRKQQLVGNLFQGARVPEGTAELPVQKNYKWTLGISLTYKIK